MAWPKGVPRKKLAEKSALAMAKKPRIETSNEVRPDLVLTVRRIHAGSFSGLWELCRVEPDGSLKVITDANTKLIVCNMARNEILRCAQ